MPQHTGHFIDLEQGIRTRSHLFPLSLLPQKKTTTEPNRHTMRQHAHQTAVSVMMQAFTKDDMLRSNCPATLFQHILSHSLFAHSLVVVGGTGELASLHSAGCHRQDAGDEKSLHLCHPRWCHGVCRSLDRIIPCRGPRLQRSASGHRQSHYRF